MALSDRVVNNLLNAARVASNTDVANPTKLANQVDQRLIVTIGPLAATTAGTDYTYSMCVFDRPVNIVSARVIPGGSLTADATNFTTVAVQFNNDGGGTATTLANATTKPTANGGTGNWSANQSIALTLASTVAVSANSQLQASLTHSGTGVAVPAQTLFEVIYQEV